MSLPPTIDDADRASGAGDRDDREDWSRWEQTFRDARPVLPDAAVSRIESAMRGEIQRTAALARPRGHRWLILLIALILVTVVAVTVELVLHHRALRGTDGESVLVGPRVEDAYVVTAPPTPRLVSPTTAALPLSDPMKVIVSAASKSVDQGVTTYRGAAVVTTGLVRITCDRLTVFVGGEPQGRLLSGAGSIRANGIPGIGDVRSEEFTFNTATGEFTFTGVVTWNEGGGAHVSRSISVSRTGKRSQPE